ncbi:UNVERIFIED_CONTAM: hypothetical protein Slati_1734900 [Sesamum latifolium]|uniref:Tf2-1-like SH3-like domain-containing protein n=1 Tax=Sesamum latifolium TaxID=2727402 RepID=A0AAW2X1A7_9LAMI
MVGTCARDGREGRTIRKRLKEAQDRDKSWANVKKRPLEFHLGDKMYLKIAPTRGVIRFDRSENLSLRYVGPYGILEKVGEVAYQIALPPPLARIHNVFQVSQLRRYIPDSMHVVEPEPLLVKENLTYE